MIAIKRVYDVPGAADGYRVLVDRLWPRGLTRETAAIDVWLKDLAPSDALRKWFGSDASRWSAFQQHYRLELTAPAIAPLLDELRARAAAGTLTLLFAKKDQTHNNAVVLRAVLLETSDS